MSFRASSFCFLGTGLIAFAAHAQSETPTPAAAQAPSLITANISLTTNYKFRGQDQDALGNNGFYKTSAVKPAVQGGFDYAHESGFYVGNWNSSVNWLAGNSIESDIYGGYKFKAGPFDLDFGVLTYIYPGNRTGNTTELYGAATWSDEAIGAFTVKYSSTVSKDYFGFASNRTTGWKGRGTGYLNIAYSKEIFPKVTLKAAVGYTALSSDIRRNTPYKSYVDYNVGATYDFGGGLSLTGAIVGANKKDAYQATTGQLVLPAGTFTTSESPNKARFIATLTKTF
ncbi:MAG: TorF family putative porin [Pseudacidovorax sp.]|uniref:TorF family putative porin n=1 Tax=Pseudacidovorax sp. TaxID=1934311 RepID=UPI001B69F6B4|nr:TorF family putative porin [Pseudacidovorax sp.]MBP6894673.1 TorF family putative porin [Pseudacidovorax sp.]